MHNFNVYKCTCFHYCIAELYPVIDIAQLILFQTFLTGNGAVSRPAKSNLFTEIYTTHQLQNMRVSQ